MTRGELEATEGFVFNVQYYSIHDGPGIRTTVFLHGCPLRCDWCQNPESQATRPQLLFDREKCNGCGRCVPSCPEGAIEIRDGRSVTDRKLCTGAGKCVDICPAKARSIVGRRVSAGEVFKKVAADSLFYQRSGGGVTLSGGEPTSQLRFSVSLLRLCKEASIHTAIETCGYVKWDTFKKVLEHVDLVLYDFKHMNSAEHERCTGVPNELILDNARRIHHELSIPLVARVPIIPGYNDSAENIRATASFIEAELGRSVKVHLLPYHRFGEGKYELLERSNRPVPLAPPPESTVKELLEVVRSAGLTGCIGG